MCPPVMGSLARIMFFDIEATHLKANFGYCLCFGYKMYGEKRTHILSITDYHRHKTHPTDDRELMKDIYRKLTQDTDIIVTFYGKEYDRKFLNTRMLMAGLPTLPPLNTEHIDLYFTARGNLLLHSNRLAVVADALGCPIQKTALSGPIWVKAMSGHRSSIEYIKTHCKRDVEILEFVYDKLRPYVRQHPRINLSEGHACRICGGTRFQRRGVRINMSQRFARTHCLDCGAWSSAPLEA